MSNVSVACAAWIDDRVEPVPNGWFPRRTTPQGKIYRKSPDGGNDPFWQSSADGLFILQLQAALTERRLADYRESLKQKTATFIRAGGFSAASTTTRTIRTKTWPTAWRSAPC